MKNMVLRPDQTYQLVWTNGTGADKAAGAICPLGATASAGYAIAFGPISSGASGVVYKEGRYTVPKPTDEAMAQGAVLAYDAINDRVTAVNAVSGGPIGFIVTKAAALSDQTVEVEIAPTGAYLPAA